MEIFVPKELEDIKPQLKTFFDAMIHKLKANAHKGKWEDLNLDTAQARLKDEVAELEEAVTEGNVVDIILETADVANFALMCSDIAIKNGRTKKVIDTVVIDPALTPLKKVRVDYSVFEPKPEPLDYPECEPEPEPESHYGTKKKIIGRKVPKRPTKPEDDETGILSDILSDNMTPEQ